MRVGSEITMCVCYLPLFYMSDTIANIHLAIDGFALENLADS